MVAPCYVLLYKCGLAVGLGYLVMGQKSSPIWKKKTHRMAHALTLQDHKGINTGWWISKNSPTGQADERKVCETGKLCTLIYIAKCG